jgi:hypothetical protein
MQKKNLLYLSGVPTPESKKLIFLCQKVEGISMGGNLGAKFD